MLALVIDTSTAAVTAAVVRVADAPDPVEVVAKRRTIDPRAHAELLAPSIAECLDAIGARPADLGAIVAGVGPGPFTGLRVGLVTAAAMADALGLPTYPVCSLDAIAVDADFAGALLVAGDARRREIYWARYDSGTRVAGPEVGRPADVAAGSSDGAGQAGAAQARAGQVGAAQARAGQVGAAQARAMTGAGARLYADVLQLPLLDFDYPSALGLATLAADRIRAGVAAEALTPLYLRRPDAVAARSFKAVTP